MGRRYTAGVRCAGRPDHNQKEIVDSLVACGASVLVTSSIGGGFPDLVVGFRGKNFLLEVKNPTNWYGKRGFNANQERFNSQWLGGQPVIVRSTLEALAAIGLQATVAA